MDENLIFDLTRQALWIAVRMAAPLLIVALVVGVVIGLFQALTQIQEQTLIYAPKIIAIFVSLILFLPLMGALLGGFMRQIAARIAEPRPGIGAGGKVEGHAMAKGVRAAPDRAERAQTGGVEKVQQVQIGTDGLGALKMQDGGDGALGTGGLDLGDRAAGARRLSGGSGVK